MKARYTILLFLLFFTAFSANAQFKNYNVKGGIQYYQLLPFSEFSAAYSFLGRGFLDFELTNSIAIEIGAGYGQYKTDDDFNEHSSADSSSDDHDHDVKTNILPIDVRLKFTPFASNNWNPYFYVGAGLEYYNVTQLPSTINIPEYAEKDKGWTAIIPVGIGTEIKLSKNVLMDLSAGASYPFTDQLNNFVLGEWEDAEGHLGLGLTFAGSDDCNTDEDKDGLTKCREEQLKTDPENPDTDGDGCKDGEEVDTYKTNPLSVDTDGDSLGDCDEIRKYSTNPLNKDTDSDKLMDNEELNTYKTLPTDSDTDNDGLIDGDEVLKYKTNPNLPDTDLGSINDGVEVGRGTDPLNPDDDLPKPKEEPAIKVGQVVLLEGINFATNSWEITSLAEDKLELALSSMKNNPDVEVEIIGHTDNTGSRNWNMELSLKRAESVKEWFVSNGISASRITTVGAGPDQPVTTNDTEEGRFQNRRIEFKRTK